MSNNKGITLIALIITIIVLLILAGTSINLILGQNGVLNKAQNAVTETKEATVLEEVQMVLAEWQTDYLVDKTPYEGRTAKTESGADVICVGGQVIVTNSAQGTIYVAPFANGVLGTFEVSTNDASSQLYKAIHPNAPEGYEHIDGEWNTGYVIKETSTGDEFVWIPVVSEASYAKKSGSRNYHMSQQGAEDNGIDVLSLLSRDELGVTSILGTTLEETDAPEATIVNAAGGFYVSRYEIGIDNVQRATIPTKVEASNYTSVSIKSQAGLEPLRYVTQEAALAISNSWKIGDDVQSGLITGTQWDTMCNFIGWTTCDSDCTSWGNYYNIASQETGTIWHSGIDAGVGDGLYYWNNTTTTKSALDDTNSRMIFATGQFVNTNGGTTNKKNIYDVAGNIWEWTTETIERDANRRVLRGGGVVDSGYNHIATYRSGGNSTIGSSWNTGFRAVLYVK